MQPAVNKPDKVKGNGKGNNNNTGKTDTSPEEETTLQNQALYGLPWEGNEDIYQTFGYDGDGNRLFSTVTITKYAPPFEEDMPLPPGKEKDNNGKGKGNSGNNGKGNDKKQLTLMSVPQLIIYMAKSDNGKGKGGGGNNGKGSDNSKGNSSDKGSNNNGNAYGKTKEKTNNGLHLGWYNRPDHPHYPGDMPPGWQVEEEFRAANYVTDINRDYPEVLMVSDEEENRPLTS